MASKKKKNKPSKKRKSQIQENTQVNKKTHFWNLKMNWIMILMIVLPFVFSRKSMEPTLSPRFILESGFLILYHIYFFGLRGETYFIPLKKLAKYAFLAMGVYTVWSLYSLFAATNFEESLYEVSRNFLNLLLLYTVIHALITEKFNFTILFRWLAFAALIHCFIGFDEYFKWGYTKLPGGVKPHGMMANRNLFGSALAFISPVVVYLIYKGKGVMRLFASFVFLNLIGAIYVAQTRSAYISSILAVITILSAVTIYFPELRKRSLSICGVVAFALLIIFASIKANQLTKRKSIREIRKIELAEKKLNSEKSIEKSDRDSAGHVSRVTSFNPMDPDVPRLGESANERLVVWQESFGIIKQHPFFGVGAGNWKVEVPNHRIGGIRNDYGRIVRIRPHNIYVQLLTENGIVGFILYFGSFVMVLIAAVIVLLRHADRDRKLLAIILIASALAFASDGFFSFPLERYEHTMFLFVFMGMVLGIYSELLDTGKTSKYANASRFLLIPIVGFLSWNIFLGMERHRFEYHMNRAKVYQKRKDNEKIVREVELGKSKFVSLDPNKDPLEIQSAMALKNLKRYEEAEIEVAQALIYNPHSARILNTQGTILTEQKKYDEAIMTYKKALKYAPLYPITLKNLTLNYLYSKDYKSCLETMEKFDYEGDEYFEKVFKVATYHYEREKNKSEKEETSE